MNYHAIWMENGRVRIVTSSKTRGVVQDVTIDPQPSSSDEPIIVTEDGVDLRNEELYSRVVTTNTK